MRANEHYPQWEYVFYNVCICHGFKKVAYSFGFPVAIAHSLAFIDFVQCAMAEQLILGCSQFE